jgi:hypothetical protein
VGVRRNVRRGASYGLRGRSMSYRRGMYYSFVLMFDDDE